MADTLYSNPDYSRFYLVPDHAGVPRGDLVLRSLTGARLDVDPDAVAPFEIPEDEAKELTKELVGKAAKRASGFLAGLGAMMQDVARKEPRPARGAREPNVAEALGVTPEQLRNDPDAVVEGLRRVGTGLLDGLRDALAGDPASEDVTRQRVRVLGEALGASADASQAGVDGLLDKVREALSDPTLKARLEKATLDIQKATADLERAVRKDPE